MGENLLELAERFIRASAEVENIRHAMLRTLSNGEGPPFAPAQRRGEKASQESPSKPNHLEAAKEAEARILGLRRRVRRGWPKSRQRCR